MDRSEFEEDPLARPLFVDSSSKRILRRRPLHEGNQTSIWVGVVIFFPLLIVAILLPFLLNDPNHNITDCVNKITNEDLPRFFSSLPMNTSAIPPEVDFQGQYILGWMNVIHISLISGLIVGLLTYFCMFYDSCVPGSFPPSPFTPPRSPGMPVSSGLALGYKMVLINIIVFSITTSFFLRVYLNVPFY